MNKFLSVALLIFAAAFFSLAQTEGKKTQQWQNFAPFGEEFSAEVPASMTIEARGDKSRFYKAESENAYIFIFSDSLRDIFQVKNVLEFVKNKQAPKSVSAVDNFTGEKFVFADDEGFYHTILIVETKNRAYVFQMTSATENNSLVERFFANIQLNRAIEKNTAVLESGEKPVQESLVSNAGIGRGEGRGSGSGNGVGNGTTSANRATPTNQTSALKILSKPRANYTDFARFYQISGKVPVRVTFLADGNIGAVTPISKLPFGLTKNAIEAARGMQFEPAMKDGTAYTVTKLVEYVFTIY